MLKDFTYIDGDSFESLADFSFSDPYSAIYKEIKIYDELIQICSIKKHVILFVNTERLLTLLNMIRAFDRNIFTIIAHNSDYIFNYDFSSNIPPNVINVWCQNYNYIETDNLKSLPIGLERVRWFPHLNKRSILKQYSEISQEFYDNTFYYNCNPKTNSERQIIYNFLSNNLNIKSTLKTNGNGSHFEEYVQDILRHSYTISPPGNGIDCHRTWEILYLNRVPVVFQSYFVENIYHDLPVWIIKNIDELLHIDAYKQICSNKYSKDKLSFEYWKNLILKPSQL